MPEISLSEQARAARNEAIDTFELRNPQGESKTFEMKHLSYDSYVEFCDLARPILEVVSGAFGLGNKNGEFKVEFNPLSLDYKQLIALAGKELPRMAWLCCKQSEPKVTIEEVKRLGHRPQALLAVVLKQIKHNGMVQEFADFFPMLVEQLTELLPAAQDAVTAIPTTTAPTE